MASNEFKLILNLILPKGSKSHILPRKNEFARINFKKYILCISYIHFKKKSYMNTSERYPKKMHVSSKVVDRTWSISVVDIFVDILFVCNSYQRASWDKYLGQIFTANSAGNHQKFPGRTNFVYICISEDLRGHSECYLSPRGSVSEPHKWNKWSGEKGWKGEHKFKNTNKI